MFSCIIEYYECEKYHTKYIHTHICMDILILPFISRKVNMYENIKEERELTNTNKRKYHCVCVCLSAKASELNRNYISEYLCEDSPR